MTSCSAASCIRVILCRHASMARSVILAALCIANPFLVPHATAELLSGRPITIVIPFTPGASADTLQRILARKVSADTGQVLVVESRPGGGGAIGAAVVKQASPDGHTLFQANSATHAANVSLYATLAYDPVKDFRPITLMWTFPQVLAIPLDSPAKSVADLVALAKSKPGGLSFASQGSGASGHLLGEMLKVRTGANMVHVPYRGAGPAGLDLAAGRVDFFFVSYSSILPFLQAGKVRALAVTSPEPLPALPQVPTMRHAGFDGMELDAWFGLVAPAGTPDAVIDKLNSAFVAAIAQPDVVRQIMEQGARPQASTPREFAAFMASETERIGRIVRAVGAKGE
ncbi:MAG: tripartite tricarboxylate transporter substrate binding protein [Alphaproteobacteria bacterium]|nr:MAG: tripartite tricarboxylate transporter substrate binding protein [Alphaproteobacteria bacterium]